MPRSCCSPLDESSDGLDVFAFTVFESSHFLSLLVANMKRFRNGQQPHLILNNCTDLRGTYSDDFCDGGNATDRVLLPEPVLRFLPLRPLTYQDDVTIDAVPAKNFLHCRLCVDAVGTPGWSTGAEEDEVLG